MNQTYRATGIILKGAPLGESDRLVTLLSPEWGLIRAVVPGARKHKSPLRGRCEQFVINELSISKGRSLDRIVHADTHESFPSLGGNLVKLAGGQYLAELTLCLALSDRPQADLYHLLVEHLHRLSSLDRLSSLYAYLSQAVYHFLAVSGFCPQVHVCCLSQTVLTADYSDPGWRVGFSFEAGGVVDLFPPNSPNPADSQGNNGDFSAVLPPIDTKLRAVELTLLQQLGEATLPDLVPNASIAERPEAMDGAWARVERTLRDYTQYQLGRTLRSAAFIDNLALLEF